jgi:thymidylate synthase (FAD)
MQIIQIKRDIDVELVQSCGGDNMVVAAAKVSTAGDEALKFADSSKSEENYGLINYLMKHRHGTPFEHSSLTFFVNAPIFVWREWHRHRIGFSYNEESGRYKVLDPVFYLPEKNRPMMKVDNWKAGCPKFSETPENIHNALCNNLKQSYQLSYDMYQMNLSMNVDPGIARACLPVGIYSRCWVTCNPRSLMSFLSLRTHEPEIAKFVSYPLWEIELAARACEDVFSKGWPLTYKAFCDNGRVGP